MLHILRYEVMGSGSAYILQDPDLSYLIVLLFSSSQTSYSHNLIFSCHFYVIFTPLPKIFTTSTPTKPHVLWYVPRREKVRFRLWWSIRFLHVFIYICHIMFMTRWSRSGSSSCLFLKIFTLFPAMGMPNLDPSSSARWYVALSFLSISPAYCVSWAQALH